MCGVAVSNYLMEVAESVVGVPADTRLRARHRGRFDQPSGAVVVIVIGAYRGNVPRPVVRVRPLPWLRGVEAWCDQQQRREVRDSPTTIRHVRAPKDRS